MTLFVEHLMREENRWALQIIQHALSLHAHVPLRLLDRKAIYANRAPRQDWIPPRADNEALFAAIPKPLVKYFNNRRNSPWITLPSNIHPLVRYLRRERRWIAWENFFICDWLKDPNASKISQRDYFHKSMKIAAYDLQAGHFDGFLIVGPCFQPFESQEMFTGHKFYGGVVKNFIDAVQQAFLKAEIAKNHDFDEMKMLGSSRTWIGQSHMDTKTVMLGRVIENLFNLQLENPIEENLQRCTYNSLAQLLYLLERPDVGDIIADLERSNLNIIVFPLVQRQKTTDPLWSVNRTGGKLYLQQSYHNEITIPGLENLASSSKIDAQRSRSRLVNLWQESRLSYGTLHYGYTNDSLSRFWNWLHNEIGLVSAPHQEKKVDDHRTMYSRLTGEVTRLFTADMCTIYIYNYPTGLLEHKFTYFQQNLSDQERSKRAREMISSMTEAGADPELRKQSIGYRCADDIQPHLCRAWNPSYGKADPPMEPILTNTSTKPRSALAVPMVVNRRLLGVLELAGLSKYQFRFANLTLAQDVSNVLATFLYQQEVLGSLNRLSENALDTTSEYRDYNKICEEFAKIFLADACDMYMPKTIGSGDYRLVAWHHMEDLDKSPERISEYSLNTNMTDSPLMTAIKEKRWSITESIESLEKKFPGWADKLPQRKILKNKIRWRVAIPVGDPRGIDRNLCGLYLFYRPNGLDSEPLPEEKWRPTVEFMSNYIAILVAAMQSRKERDDRIQDMLGHELSQAVKAVANSARGILAFFEQDVPTDIPREGIKKYILDKISLKYSDLTSFQAILSKMVGMLEAEKFQDLIESGLDPLMYLIIKEEGLDLNKHPERINIRHLFNEIWKSQEEDCRRKSVKYLYEFAQRGPIIIANKLLANRIFQNLFVNAAKYSIKGSKIVAKIVKEEDIMEIHLINSAESLRDQREVRSIFIEKSRGSNAINKTEGKGYGLSIARRLCQYMEWGIHLNTKINPGNISDFDFYVTIPLSFVK